MGKFDKCSNGSVQHQVVYALSNQLGGHVCCFHVIIAFPDEPIAKDAMRAIIESELELGMLVVERFSRMEAMELAGSKPAGFQKILVMSRSDWLGRGELEVGLVIEEIIPPLTANGSEA